MEKTIAQQLNVKDFPFTIKDEKGNKIYFENAAGFWWKKEYDSNGGEVYYENSYGFWRKKEYCAQGNEVYYEDSGGQINDKRNIPEYTVKNEEKVTLDQLSQAVAKLANQVGELKKIIEINEELQNEQKGNDTNRVSSEVIDSKVIQLLSLSAEFIFPEYYSHKGKTMWKISNIYAKYGSETLVLCGVDEGFETAIDLAIEHISKAKAKFYGVGV